jgi:hypothetical protein
MAQLEVNSAHLKNDFLNLDSLNNSFKLIMFWPEQGIFVIKSLFQINKKWAAH